MRVWRCLDNVLDLRLTDSCKIEFYTDFNKPDGRAE